MDMGIPIHAARDIHFFVWLSKNRNMVGDIQVADEFLRWQPYERAGGSHGWLFAATPPRLGRFLCRRAAAPASLPPRRRAAADFFDAADGSSTRDASMPWLAPLRVAPPCHGWLLRSALLHHGQPR